MFLPKLAIDILIKCIVPLCTVVNDISKKIPIAFDWDDGNINKNWLKHKVLQEECEQVLVNSPRIFEDFKHSIDEKRMTAYGETDAGRRLTVVFTIRQLLIRVISARDQNSKEKKKYETE
jgi:uncharacterized protein